MGAVHEACLSDRHRTRLVKALRLLASPHAGEVAAAAAGALRVLKAAGLDWDAVIVPAADGPRAAPDGARDGRHGRKARSKPQPPPPPPVEPHEAAALAAELLRWRECLSPRETDFLTSMLTWRTRLTERQASWLAVLAERVRTRAHDPGY